MNTTFIRVFYISDLTIVYAGYLFIYALKVGDQRLLVLMLFVLQWADYK